MPSEAPTTGSLRQPLSRLQGERTTTLVSTFQLTRTVKLCLTHQNELNRAQSEAIGKIKQLDELSQKLWESLKSAEQNSHQAALRYRDAINGVVQNDLLPAFTGAIRTMAAKLNNAHA